jgi:hypothetical protein
MTEDRIVAICAKVGNTKQTLAEFFCTPYGAKKGNSNFLYWSQFVPSNCNTNTPTVTMQKDVTIPENLQSSLKLLKACKKFRAKDEKKIIDNLLAIDDWIKQEYVWIDEFNHGKGHSLYDSVEDIVYNIIGIVERWEKCENFNESFFDMGSKAWNIYVSQCSREGVEIMLGDGVKKAMVAEREAKEATRKMRERNALREEAGLPPQVIPTADGKLPYEIENERLAAIKAGKRQVELDERKRKEDEIREQVKQGRMII